MVIRFSTALLFSATILLLASVHSAAARDGLVRSPIPSKPLTTAAPAPAPVPPVAPAGGEQ
jgi:hypothetical protein